MSNSLKASKRDKAGKYAAFALRKQEQIPGILYGLGGAASEMLSIPAKEFAALVGKGDRMVDLEVEGVVRKAILFDVQHGVFSHEILHADFKPIDENKALDIEVQIVLKGGEEAAGVLAGGMLSQQLFSVMVRCLPRHLPENITLDATAIQLDQTLHISDLPTLEGVEYRADSNQAVATCHLPHGETAAAEVGGDGGAEPEVIGAKKPDEDEKTATKDKKK